MKKSHIAFIHLALVLLAACAPAPAPPPTLTPHPTVQGFRDFPSTMEGNGVKVVPGFYKFPAWYGNHLTVELKEEGWKVVTLERSELLALVQGENEVGYPDKWLIFLPVYGEEAGTLLDDLIASPKLSLVAGPEQRTVAGSLAAIAVFDALPNPEFAGTDEYVAGVQELDVIQAYAGNWQWFTSSPEARIEYISLSINGQPIGVYIEAPAAEFEAFAAQAMTVLAELKPQ
jgi:hypothetical protein